MSYPSMMDSTGFGSASLRSLQPILVKYWSNTGQILVDSTGFGSASFRSLQPILGQILGKYWPTARSRSAASHQTRVAGVGVGVGGLRMREAIKQKK
jgi:hypothetical protein